MEDCQRCGKDFTITDGREVAMDICDDCNNHLQRLGDRDYRMEYTRATVAYIDASAGYNNERRKEMNLRGFFACVMPEYPLKKVEKVVKAICRK